jgi:NADH-quinone oxidoreductase subunit N
MLEFKEIFYGAMPEFLLAFLAMSTLMVGAFQQRDGLLIANRLAVGSLFVTLLLMLFLYQMDSDFFAPSYGFNMFVNLDFTLYIKIFLLLGSMMALLVSRKYLEHTGLNRFEYPVLVMLSTIGMMFMISANDFLSVYIGLELQSLCLYVLASFNRDSRVSSEAGLKYFVLGALASGLFLFGCTFVYGYAGSTNFTVLRAFLGSSDTVSIFGLVGLVFIIVGFCFKISAVPFHMWTPDVYEGSPTPVTAFFSIVPKVAGVAILLRVLFDAFGSIYIQWQQIFYVISILSMLLGAFAGMWQTDFKRLMAYSSIGHVGYMLIGVVSGSEFGIRGVLYYLAIYLFMNIGAFAVMISLRNNNKPVSHLSDLSGLSQGQPLHAAMLAIFMFSMAGIPPLAGFFSKFYIFVAAIDANLYVLAVIGVLSSVVSAFYYIRIVKLIYFDQERHALDVVSSLGLKAVMLVSTIFVLGFFLMPDYILNIANDAAIQLIENLR